MNNKILRRLQLTELEILDEIVRICDKFNLKYYLAGGTLLGAVRHQGFIPWDDDIDISMPRSDYEKFIKIAPKELSNKYFLDSYETNKKYWQPFAKVRKNNTIMLEKVVENYNTHHGIWVDIFPIDNLDADKMDQVNIIKDKYEKLFTLIAVKLGINYYNENKIKKKILSALLFFVPKKILTNKLTKLISSNKNEKSKYLICYCGFYINNMEKERNNRSDIFPLKKIEFEGKKYNCPNNCDKYLKDKYGNYMELPKEEDRRTHNPLKLEFDE